jgi:hypothetical protein
VRVFLPQRVKLLSTAEGFTVTLSPAGTHAINPGHVRFLTLDTERLLSLWKAVSNTKQNPERWQDWKGTLKAASQCLEPEVFVCTVASFHHYSDHKLFKGCKRCQKDSWLLKLGKVWNVNAWKFYQIAYCHPKPFRGVLKKHIWRLTHDHSQRSKQCLKDVLSLGNK